jgi:hypothetical protein
MENLEKTKITKILSTILIVILLINVFSPCLSFAAYKQDGQDKYNVLRVSDITKSSSGNYVFYVEYAAIADTYIGSFDISLSYDTSKFATARKDTGAANTSVARVTYTNSDCFTFQTKTVSNGGIRMLGTTTDWWCATDDGDSSASFGKELSIFKVYFYLLDPSQWKLDGSKEITSDMISLKPTASSQTGYKQRIAQDIDGTSPTYITNTKYLATEGFTEKEKSVNSISVKTNPSKTTYEHDDTINLAGGVLKVTYDDNSTEDISMTDSNVKITKPTTGKADVNNQTITISYKGKTTTLKLNVTDPVKSLAVATPMSKVEYNHGETFDFTGLALKATKKSGATINLTSSSSGVTKSETTANVNSANFTKTSAEGTVPVSGIQKITFTYEGKTTTQSVAVNDTISSIALTKQPTKTIYKQGENLDLTGAVVQVTLGSGGKANINLPDGSVTVSTYNPSTTGSKQHLTVKLGTATASDTIDVEAYNYISNSTLVKPSKTSYKYGETLELKGGKLDFTWKSGNMTNTSLTTDMVSGYSATKLGTQTITVKYNAKYTLSDGNTVTDTITKTFTVSVDNEAKSIEITPPSKTQYNYGSKLELAGGKISVRYADGTTENVTMTANMITEDDGSTVNMSPDVTSFVDNKYSKTLKISYTEDEATKTVNYPITIINDIKSISMHTTPTKTKYNVNDTLDVTNGEIKIVRAVGNPEIKTITSNMVSGFDSSKENTNLPLTVSYTENGIRKTTTYNVSVEDQVTAIKIVQAPKTGYKYNEELDVSTGKIEITKGSGTTTIPMTASMVTGYDKTKLGDQELTVTYGGKTEKYKVNVKDYVTGISITPNEITGKYNSELQNLINDNNIMYTITYAKAGAKTPTALTESMVAGYNKTSVTNQILTVTYVDSDVTSATKTQTFKTNLKVSLSNPTQSIAIKQNPTKTEYGYGDTIDLSNGKITITKANGDTEEKALTDSSVKVTETDGSAVDLSKVTFGKDNTATKTIKVTYDGKDTTYQIKITNKITGIKMHTTPKAQYNVNDALDLTTDGSNPGEILVTRQTGTPSVVSITESNVKVTGFDSSKENTKLPLTVSYTENGETKTTTYDVSIKDTVTAVSMKNTPKTEYKYNEPLDLINGTISVTKGSGTKDIAITDNMVSGYNPTKLGKQTITITYGGKTTSYEVNVKDYVTGISINPNAITGTYNDEIEKLINDNDISYTVTYAKAGAKSPVALTESMVTGYNKKSLTDQNSTVTYTDQDTNSYTNGKTFTTNLSVKLKNEISKVTITKPTKTEYNHGDQIDLTGGKITVTYTDGTTKEEPITSAVITEKDGGSLNMNPTISEYGKDNKVSKTLTLKYTANNGIIGTASYPITITNTIQSVAIETLPTKVKYNVKETLDTTGGRLKITRATGTTETIDITKEMISGFDSSKENTKLPLTISYTENGVTKTTTFTISVEDPIISMEIKTTPKTEYKYGEPLDLSNGIITIVRPSGPEEKQITEEMVTGYEPTKIGEQELTIKYGGQELKYKVNVKDYITGIILTPPTKVKYEYGEALDLTGGNIQEVMASGATTSQVALTDSQITISGYNPKQEGAQTIDVIYKGQKEQFGVIVENNIQSIIMKTTPKTEYKYGEPLNITGGTIETIRSNGAKETINITTSMVTGYNPNKIGKQKITVTYKDKTTSYEVDVKDYIEDIDIVKPNKLVYKIGEKIDLTDGKVKPIMASKTATTPVAMTNSEVQIEGFDTSTEGAKTIKVTYKGYTKSFGITVINQTSSMTIKTLPNKLEYKYGEQLDLTGGTIEFKQGNETKILNITKDMVTGYNSKKIGNQTLTVTYEGLTQEFIVNVKDYITKLKLEKPEKTDYEYGENLDLTGGTISIITASGKVDEKTDMTASMISGYDKTKEGTQTITVEYKGLQGKFQVSVKDKIKAISLNNEPNKINYKNGEALDITGATIDIIKSSGINTIPVTYEMISGYNPQNSGLQVVTITYKGFKTKFLVLVAEKEEVKEPEQEEIKEEPKQEEIKQEEPKTEIIKTVTKNKTIIINNDTKEDKEEQPTEEKVEAPINEENNQKPNTESTEEKETATLGVEDEKVKGNKQIATAIGIAGLILLLLLLLFKRNVKIYVEEDGEFVLGGIDKLTKKHPELNIDEYLDGETYPNKVKIHLSDTISEKLDGKEIKIKHRGKIIKIKIVYDDKPYEIILK